MNIEITSDLLYVCAGILICFGPPMAKRLIRKRRQKGYRKALAWVLQHGSKTKYARIWVQRTDAGEFLLKYVDIDEAIPYESILADSETVNDAVTQLEAAGFTVEDGPG